MADESAPKNVSLAVLNALHKLDRLAILPAAANAFVRGLFEMRLSPDELSRICESEPAIAAMIFSLVHQQGINIPSDKISIRSAVVQLPLRIIRDNFFSAKTYSPPLGDNAQLELRKNLIVFASAVSHCSRAIAEQGTIDINSDLAYAAGLLHNIGNLALDEAMPRSFQSMLEQAKEKEISICEVQRQNIYLDYPTIGKRLAQKWHFPESITTAIWLHQSNTEAVIQTIPQAKIAHIVRLAYLIARQFNIGSSASFDSAEITESLLKSVGITSDQAVQIGEETAEAIKEKAKYFGKNLQADVTEYCHSLGEAASQLAADSSKLASQVQQSHTKSSHFDFTAEFLAALEPVAEPMEIAENFACQFKKFYQTGKICLCLADSDIALVNAIIVNDDSNVQTVQLIPPQDAQLLPKEIAENFDVINAPSGCKWIFEQIGVDFNLGQTKIAPLVAKGTVLGMILFEFRYPVQTAQLQEMFKATGSIAAFLLDMSINRQKQQFLAEDFVRLIVAPSTAKPFAQPPQKSVLGILAEMAAGAAHELNNPLAVISGRAQLLSQSETDLDKKQSLLQIQANCRQLADIVNDLMSFAEPAPPRKTNVSLNQLIEEAMQLATLKTGLEYINAQTDIPDSVTEVFVDSGQIVPALSNILCNAVQSYTDPNGPVKITAESIGDFVRLTISDLGSGMDAKTLEKITYPFFSSKPAGRKRGMGLAHADRLVQLNGGRLNISSESGKGTTVTITLPAAN